MPAANVVSREEWLEARKAHLQKEKEFTRLRDELSAQRRELPWVKVDKEYLFAGPAGTQSLADLFQGKSQLIVYHFMMGVDWDEGCPSCSFWADNYNGIDIHLANRDISLVTVSRAPLEVIDAYKERMGWSFTWVSAIGDAFNEDYQVSPSAEDKAKGETFYNYQFGQPWGDEAPGISVLSRMSMATFSIPTPVIRVGWT